nr:integrase, catalytic region, zinc finger, CCHC-type, peptidase aspartic, catalytic [Tanacetum cinerariifolium]
MWEAIERLQQGESLNIQDVKTNLFLECGKEIAKPITPPSESASEEDNDPKQAQRDKDMQKNLALITKYFKRIYKPTNHNLRTSSNSRNKNVDTTPLYKNDNQFGQFGNQRTMNVARARENTQMKRLISWNWKHITAMAKIQEVPIADTGTDSEPLEQVQNDNGYNVFANDLQHSEQSKSISNTCLVEMDDINVILDSPYMCKDDIQNDQNDVESDDEHALAELQCLYLYIVKECDCLAQKLSKQTKSVSNEVHAELLQCFAKVEKHSISHEIALQKCKEHVKNDTVWNEQASNVFRKEREQYIKIQDLKAQLQDKNISISELKKLIEKCKGKSMETKFDKPSVVRQPNAQRIPKPLVLGKPIPFLDSLERIYFSKTKLVPKTNVSKGLSKTVTAQNLPQTARQAIVQLILFIVNSGCTKHMMGNLKLLCNFVEKFLGTVRFGNGQFASILDYGDLVQGNITINRVYYVKGLNHNLFSVGEFCDANLEVAIRKSTCFVRDLQGNDLLTGNHGSDLYTISLQESTSSTPLCLIAKASPTQAWLWHRRLSHLNFDYINLFQRRMS